MLIDIIETIINLYVIHEKNYIYETLLTDGEFELTENESSSWIERTKVLITIQFRGIEQD